MNFAHNNDIYNNEHIKLYNGEDITYSRQIEYTNNLFNLEISIYNININTSKILVLLSTRILPSNIW